ncbi:MAG: hypothetical protein LIO62_08550 [Clostridiales bacterium]|nr:hypothetical protein [Clostridiales bacterium]
MKTNKAFIILISIIVIAFTFVACSSTEYVDVVVTETVTDENGEAVTDENGEAVTVLVTDADGETQTTAVDADSTNEDDITVASSDGSDETSNASSGSTTASQDSETTAKTTTTKKSTTKSGSDSSKTTTTKKATTKKTTTKKATTTTTTTEAATKSKKRKVSVVIELPSYGGTESTMTVSYRVYDSSKWSDWTELDPITVVLNGVNTETVELGKLKGKVQVKVTIDGLSLKNNTCTIPAGEDDAVGTISPVTGIEILEGDDLD